MEIVFIIIKILSIAWLLLVSPLFIFGMLWLVMISGLLVETIIEGIIEKFKRKEEVVEEIEAKDLIDFFYKI